MKSMFKGKYYRAINMVFKSIAAFIDWVKKFGLIYTYSGSENAFKFGRISAA